MPRIPKPTATTKGGQRFLEMLDRVELPHIVQHKTMIRNARNAARNAARKQQQTPSSQPDPALQQPAPDPPLDPAPDPPPDPAPDPPPDPAPDPPLDPEATLDPQFEEELNEALTAEVLEAQEEPPTLEGAATFMPPVKKKKKKSKPGAKVMRDIKKFSTTDKHLISPSLLRMCMTRALQAHMKDYKGLAADAEQVMHGYLQFILDAAYEGGYKVAQHAGRQTLLAKGVLCAVELGNFPFIHKSTMRTLQMFDPTEEE